MNHFRLTNPEDNAIFEHFCYLRLYEYKKKIGVHMKRVETGVDDKFTVKHFIKPIVEDH